MPRHERKCLVTLLTDPPREFHVFRVDRDTLGVNGAEIGILEETGEVVFGTLLKSQDAFRLPAHVGVELHRNLFHKALEGQLAKEKLGRLLVATNLAESDGAGPVAMRLFYACIHRRGLTSGFSGKSLARSFSTRALVSRLLGASHLRSDIYIPILNIVFENLKVDPKILSASTI